MTSELASLLNGLGWVLEAQNPDGGWAPSKGQSSTVGSSGHVMLALLHILGVRPGFVEQGLVFLESAYKKPSQTTGYWAHLVLGGTPNRDDELLCSYDLLLARALGRNLVRIDPQDVIVTATQAIEHFINMAEKGNIDGWALHMCSLLLSLGDFDQRLHGRAKDTIARVSTSLVEDKGLGLVNGDLASYAHVTLGLLHFADKSLDELIVRAVEDLSSRGQRDQHGAYWPHSATRQGGPFDPTRWVLWAMMDAWAKGILRPDTGIMAGGISWIIGHQKLPEGYWVGSDGRIFEPNYIGYALLVLWKWIQEQTKLPQDVVVLLAQKMKDASRPVSDYELLESECRQKESEYKQKELECRSLKSRNNRLLVYLATTATFLAAALAWLLYVTELGVHLLLALEQWGTQIARTLVIALLAAAIVGFLRRVISLRRRDKSAGG